MTKKTKVRTLVAMLIAIVLGGGYLIADKQEVKNPGSGSPAGFAAFH
jgi:hypothetical protein